MAAKVKLDMDVVMAAAEEDDGTGFCIACGAEAYGVEPDARKYECDECGENKVYGAMELLLMVG
jgi:hypothetical protein